MSSRTATSTGLPTWLDMVNATRFATAVVMQEEMESLSEDDLKPEFKSMTQTSLSWAEYGIDYIPNEVANIYPHAVEYKFTEASCIKQDCFGWQALHSLEPRLASLRPQPCKRFSGLHSELNNYEFSSPKAEISLSIGYGDHLTACAPSCWQSNKLDSATKSVSVIEPGLSTKVRTQYQETVPNDPTFQHRSRSDRLWKRDTDSPLNSDEAKINDNNGPHAPLSSGDSISDSGVSNIATVFWKNQCWIANNLARDFCINPINRDSVSKKGLTDAPPFKWYADKQRCHVTDSYCRQYAGMTFRDGDCVLSSGQKLSEMVLGKNVVRGIKAAVNNKGTDNLFESAISEQMPPSSAISYDTAWNSNLVNNQTTSSSLRQYSGLDKMTVDDESNYTRANSNLIEQIKSLGVGIGADMGVHLTVDTMRNVMVKSTSKLLSSIPTTYVLSDGSRRLLASPQLFAGHTRRMISTIFSSSVQRFVAASSKALSASLWGADALLLATQIWDAVDPKYNFILDQTKLDATIAHLHKLWARQLGYHENSPIAHGVPTIPWTPYAAYELRFGDFLSDNSPRRQKCETTFFAAVSLYLNSIKVNSLAEPINLEPFSIDSFIASDIVTENADNTELSVNQAASDQADSTPIEPYLLHARVRPNMPHHNSVSTPNSVATLNISLLVLLLGIPASYVGYRSDIWYKLFNIKTLKYNPNAHDDRFPVYSNIWRTVVILILLVVLYSSIVTCLAIELLQVTMTRKKAKKA